MLLTQSLLSNLSQKAATSPRLRTNYNLHESIQDSVQRMFNAMEPGTVVPIHRHKEANETMVLLRGKMRVMLYDDNGKEMESTILAANGETFGIHIPKGIWHSVEVLDEGTVMLEVKEGPYEPLKPEDIVTHS